VGKLSLPNWRFAAVQFSQIQAKIQWLLFIEASSHILENYTTKTYIAKCSSTKVPIG
jgi:hypothetical protein